MTNTMKDDTVDASAAPVPSDAAAAVAPSDAGAAPAPDASGAPGDAPRKLGFAEAFALAFSQAMAEEHEEFEKMEPRFAPGEGIVEVVEPEGEGHFGDLDDAKK